MDKECGHQFKEPPQFAYRRRSTLRDLISPTEPKQKENNTYQSKNIGTFPCYNCNCFTSIIKGPNIHHPTKGTEIYLKATATCTSAYVVKVYVGQTIYPVKERIKEHKSNIRNYKENSQTDTSVSRHFWSNKHNQSQLNCLVLEVVCKPQRSGDFKKLLLQRQAMWIKKLSRLVTMGVK
ncbi:hypothetical protein XELAEV_18014736mg [Xenopus laevis]|uniref:GIY-YIG domain-containing protein n=1 Tax=Xenopus laevis TaxID=8355 RepID=A0A974DIL3_XENLA|nr:hypothetical protein XELAEV_18014736mg [Xenopus laevis]